MIINFIKAWEENKGQLENYFRTHEQKEYCESYKDILSKVIEFVLNPYLEKIDKPKLNNISDDDYGSIKIVDFGDYQGTLILTFSEDEYQPSVTETYYTSVCYGSCSGCDTLQGIYQYEDDELPNESQIKDYMTLSLHLIQNMKRFDNNEIEGEYYDKLPIYIIDKKVKSEYTGFYIDTTEVTIMKHKDTGKYSFINLTKCHICPCQFDSIEDAEKDLEKQINEGKIISYNKIV